MKINVGNYIKLVAENVNQILHAPVKENSRTSWYQTHQYNLQSNKVYVIKGEKVLLKQIMISQSRSIKKGWFNFRRWIVPQVEVNCLIARKSYSDKEEEYSGLSMMSIDYFIKNMEEVDVYRKDFENRVDLLNYSLSQR